MSDPVEYLNLTEKQKCKDCEALAAARRERDEAQTVRDAVLADMTAVTVERDTARAELAKAKEAVADWKENAKRNLDNADRVAARCQQLEADLKKAESEMVLKPSSEWEKRFEQDGHKIIDPDGWDRTPDGWDKSWSEPITWWEFNRRVSRSTCQWDLAALAPDQGRETCRWEKVDPAAYIRSCNGNVVLANSAEGKCNLCGKPIVEVPKGGA